MLEFVVQSAGQPDRRVQVAAESVTGGSAPGLLLRVDDPIAAERHFEIEIRSVGVVLKDLETSAGTRVNGSLVSQVRLEAGDTIEVGGTKILFAAQAAAAPAAAAVSAPVPVPVAAAPRAPAPQSSRPERSHRNQSRAAGPVFALILLVLGGVAAFVLFGRGGDDGDTTEVAKKPVIENPTELPEKALSTDGTFEVPDRLRPKSELEPEPVKVEEHPLPEPPVEEEETEPTAAPEPEPEKALEPDPTLDRKRIEATAEARLTQFQETLTDRISRYSFAGPIADLEALLEPVPEGRVREEIAGWLADLQAARSLFALLPDLVKAGKIKSFQLASGLRVVPIDSDPESFAAKVGGAVIRKKWTELRPETVHGLGARTARSPEHWLAAAAFAALYELPEESEDNLVRALRRDVALKAEIDATIARRRGTEVPAGGFVLHEGLFVTPEEKGYLDRGLVKYEGKWLDHDQLMAAKGFVKHEGKWLSPERYERILEAQRQAEALAKKFMPKGLIDKPGNGEHAMVWAEAEEKKKVLEIKTANYLIRTNLGKEVAKDLAYTMETLNMNFRLIFGLRKNMPRFKIEVCATKDSYVSEFKGGGSLGYTTSGGVIRCFYQPPMTTAVLMHEGVHQFLYKFAPACARWMHEGTASYFECSQFEFDAKKKRVNLKVGLLNSMRLEGFKREQKTGRAVPLEDFLRGKGGNPYTEGWALVYYLAKGMDGKYADRLLDFIQASGKGDAVKHFKKIFRVRDLQAWEKGWLEWINALDPADGIRVNSPHK